MPSPFTQEQIATLRLLDRKGWTFDQWRDLPEDEQEEWLAYEHYRREQINKLLEWHRHKMAKDEGIDVTSYFLLLRSSLD